MVLPEINSNQMMRLADASLNRVAEGLRYLEDVCRFMLNDTALNRRLKNIRHELVVGDWENQKLLIDARDAGDDVGASLEAPADKETTRDLISSVVANSRRVQEALRSLEETSKITGLPVKLSSTQIQQTRFDMYSIEKEILGKLTRQEKAKKVHGLYVVIDTQALSGRDILQAAKQVIQGGAKVIQLRDKMMDKGQLLPVATQMGELCRQSNVLFIINDYIDMALAVKADGVHLGQTDFPVAVARKLLPIDILIGCSVTNVKMAKKAQADGADYIAVSGVYPTTSKDDVKPLGAAMIKRIRKAIGVPLVAIGGIKLENIPESKKCGVDAVAVISAVLGAKSPAAAARQLSQKFEET